MITVMDVVMGLFDDHCDGRCYGRRDGVVIMVSIAPSALRVPCFQEFKALLGNLFYFNKLWWLFDHVQLLDATIAPIAVRKDVCFDSVFFGMLGTRLRRSRVW